MHKSKNRPFLLLTTKLTYPYFNDSFQSEPKTAGSPSFCCL